MGAAFFFLFFSSKLKNAFFLGDEIRTLEVRLIHNCKYGITEFLGKYRFAQNRD